MTELWSPVQMLSIPATKKWKGLWKQEADQGMTFLCSHFYSLPSTSPLLQLIPSALAPSVLQTKQAFIEFFQNKLLKAGFTGPN